MKVFNPKISKGPWRWAYTNWNGCELRGDKGEICCFGSYYSGQEPETDDQIAIAAVPEFIDILKMAKTVCERRQRLNDTNDDSPEFNIAVMDLENATASLTTLIEKFEELHGKVEAQND